MKTKKQIQCRLSAAQESWAATVARFEKYDNHDDMDMIPMYMTEVKVLEWVLKGNDE